MNMSTVILLSFILLQAPQRPVGRIAQLVGTRTTYTWEASNNDNLVIDAATVLPAGMSVNAVGSQITFDVNAVSVGIHEASLVIKSKVMPTPDWTGLPVDVTQTAIVQWIVFDEGLENFLQPFNDILLPSTLD
jgi:hypothetical protein